LPTGEIRDLRISPAQSFQFLCSDPQRPGQGCQPLSAFTADTFGCSDPPPLL